MRAIRSRDTARCSAPAARLSRLVPRGEAGGWKHPFWWPVFAAPTDAEPCVFAQNEPQG